MLSAAQAFRDPTLLDSYFDHTSTALISPQLPVPYYNADHRQPGHQAEQVTQYEAEYRLRSRENRVQARPAFSSTSIPTLS